MQLIATGKWSKKLKTWRMVVAIRRAESKPPNKSSPKRKSKRSPPR